MPEIEAAEAADKALSKSGLASALPPDAPKNDLSSLGLVKKGKKPTPALPTLGSAPPPAPVALPVNPPPELSNGAAIASEAANGKRKAEEAIEEPEVKKAKTDSAAEAATN